MNVIFHTMAGLATAAILSARKAVTGSPLRPSRSEIPVATLGFVLGILTHGLLDMTPHNYPLNSAIDVTLSLLVFALALSFAIRRNMLLLSACFFGSIFPDLVDLGPAILGKRFGWSMPQVKFFPWHWPRYSGSIYDGRHRAESLLCHLAVAALSLGILHAFRTRLFRAKHS